jgi:putative phage-type endonuclease
MKYKVIELEQGTDDWLSFRVGKVGGSDIASVMEIADAYKSRRLLLEEKATGTARAVTDFQQAMFDRGHKHEAEARTAFESETGFEFKPVVLQNVDEPRFFASLDGFNAERRHILEVKSTTKEAYITLAKHGEPPMHWYAQIQWQLFVSDSKRATLLVVDADTENAYPVEIVRNDSFVDKAIVSANKFLEEIDQAFGKYVQNIDHIDLYKIAEAKKNVAELKKKIKVYEDEINQKAAKMLEVFGARSIEGCGVKVQIVERKGNVDYAKIPELKDVDLEQYRKRPSEYIKITTKDEE